MASQEGSRTEPTRLRIYLMGDFAVAVGDKRVDEERWRLRKAKAVIKLLALAPRHRLHREQLMDILWPDLAPSAAANQLRKALHAVRRTLTPDPEAGARLIGSRDEFVMLPSDAWVDVDAFRAAAADARRTGDPVDHLIALEVYGGELLPEDRYEEWAEPVRDELRGEFLSMCLEAAELFEARADLDQAAMLLSRVVEVDPTNEQAHRGLMRVYALAGRRHDAVRQYERLRDILRRELEVEPDVETHQLYEEIRAGQALRPELRSGLWEKVGDLRRLSGDASGAASAYRSALEGIGDEHPGAAARLHRKTASARLVEHETSESGAHLDAAESLLVGAGHEAELGRLLGVRANWFWDKGLFEQAKTAAEESLRLAELHGGPGDVAAAYETLSIVFHFRGEWREGLHVELERLGMSADDHPELGRIFDIHHCIGEYHLYGDALFEGVEDYARRTLEMATRSGARRAQAFAWCLLGESLLLRGHWDEAAGSLDRSGEIHAELGERSGALPWQRLGELAVCRGEIERAEPYLRRGMAIATVSPMAQHMWGRLYATEALAALETGDPEAAVRAVRAALESAARHGSCPTCSAMINPLAAEAYAALEDGGQAASHADSAERTAGFWESSAWGAMAVTARAFQRAAAGEASSAADGLIEAAGLYERGGQPFWAARCRLSAALIPGGIPEPARRALLEEAEQVFRRLGARLAERRAAETLASV